MKPFRTFLSIVMIVLCSITLAFAGGNLHEVENNVVSTADEKVASDSQDNVASDSQDPAKSSTIKLLGQSCSTTCNGSNISTSCGGGQSCDCSCTRTPICQCR